MLFVSYKTPALENDKVDMLLRRVTSIEIGHKYNMEKTINTVIICLRILLFSKIHKVHSFAEYNRSNNTGFIADKF